MSSDDIRISVALVTRNAPSNLERCLQSLRSQSQQPFEIVVSDDSTPDFEQQTKEVAEKYDCRHHQGPRRGLYANRNCAAIACAGTHIRTMDDDHTFPPGHWEECEAAVKEDAKAFWSIGEVCLIDGAYWGTAETSNQLHPSGLGCHIDNPENNWAVADGSTIYPATIFREGHRMIETFSYGSAYLEFGAYLYQLGYVGKCLRGSMVQHHASVSTLTRKGADTNGSRLYAVLAYNLHFRPSLFKAIKYITACIADSKSPAAMACFLPAAKTAVSKRWGSIGHMKRTSN